MKAEIISQLAYIIRHDLVQKDPKDLKLKRQASVPKDEVEISKAGEAYANAVTPQSEMEKEEHLKVERLKSLLNGNRYHLDEQTIEKIADKIARSLLG